MVLEWRAVVVYVATSCIWTRLQERFMHLQSWFGVYSQPWTYPVLSPPSFPPFFSPLLSPSLPFPIPLFLPSSLHSSVPRKKKQSLSTGSPEPAAATTERAWKAGILWKVRWGVGYRTEGSSGKYLEGFGCVQRRGIILLNVIFTVIFGSICHMGFS